MSGSSSSGDFDEVLDEIIQDADSDDDFNPEDADLQILDVNDPNFYKSEVGSLDEDDDATPSAGLSGEYYMLCFLFSFICSLFLYVFALCISVFDYSTFWIHEHL